MASVATGFETSRPIQQPRVDVKNNGDFLFIGFHCATLRAVRSPWWSCRHRVSRRRALRSDQNVAELQHSAHSKVRHSADKCEQLANQRQWAEATEGDAATSRFRRASRCRQVVGRQVSSVVIIQYLNNEILQPESDERFSLYLCLPRRRFLYYLQHIRIVVNRNDAILTSL